MLAAMGDVFPDRLESSLKALHEELKEEAQSSAGSFKQARDRLMARFERDYLVDLIEGVKGNISAAARKANLSRSQFYRLLERHGLNDARMRDGAAEE